MYRKLRICTGSFERLEKRFSLLHSDSRPASGFLVASGTKVRSSRYAKEISSKLPVHFLEAPGTTIETARYSQDTLKHRKTG